MLNELPIRIAISGKSGCGNTTVSRILAKRLNLELINYTFRSIAEEEGISFEDVARMAETRDDEDLRVDQKQVEMARRTPCVLGSRLAIWMLKEADLKVYLAGSPEIRAARIFQREGGTPKEQLKVTKDRDKRDHHRYVRLYGIDNNDFGVADLMIKTDRLTAQQVADIIEVTARSLGR